MSLSLCSGFAGEPGGGLVNPRVDLHSMFSESKNNRFSP